MGITRKQALDSFASDDLIGLGMEADAIRRRLHPEGVVSYVLDGLLDYSESPTSDGFEEMEEKIAKMEARGVTALRLRGTPSAGHTVEWFEGLFRRIKQRFPSLWLHSLSATEVLTLARESGSSIEDVIERLHNSGLDSLPGDDAGILDDAVQQQNHIGRTAAEWIAVHRAAHKLGVQTTAAMVFGSGETVEHRVNHLEALRELQQETGGFASFTPWTFSAPVAAPGFEEATAVEYLKTLAISRMYLDEIANVQSDLETQGLKVLQVGLRFGGNDAGSVLLAQGANAASEEQLRQVIRDAGFKPVQRDTLYETMFLN